MYLKKAHVEIFYGKMDAFYIEDLIYICNHYEKQRIF